MSSIRQLEERLRAWRSFHGIAGATRNLAAAQRMRWSETARRAEEHRGRCQALRDAYPGAQPPRDAPRVILALGTDLGLCGSLNRAIANRLAAERQDEPSMILAMGERLRMLVEGDVIALPAPTSFERVEVLATQIEALLGPPERERLAVVVTSGVDPDGRPQVTTDEDRGPSEARTRRRRAVELVDPAITAEAAASLSRHARLVALMSRAAASEAEARWRTMNRAHDAAERRIAEQQRELDKRRQELVTQEMLEARQGSRARSASLG